MKKDDIKDQILALVNLSQDDTVFNVEINPNQFIQTPNIFTIQKLHKPEPGEPGYPGSDNDYGTESRRFGNFDVSKDSNAATIFNKIAMMLNFKCPVKDYPVTLMLKNQTRTDVRIYDM